MDYNKVNRDLLSAHLDFIEAASDAYDKGYKDEAHRLATVLSIVLSKALGTSLLHQLNLLDELYFLSTTSNYIQCTKLTYLGFLTQVGENAVGGSYYPNCELNASIEGKWLTFENWWHEIVFDDNKNRFTRADIVLAITGKEHDHETNPLLDESYNSIVKNKDIHDTDEVTDAYDLNPSYAAIRQIAFELLTSFNWNDLKHSSNIEPLDEKYYVYHLDGNVDSRDSRYIYHSLKDNAAIHGFCAAELDRIFEHPNMKKKTTLTYLTETILLKNGETRSRNLII